VGETKRYGDYASEHESVRVNYKEARSFIEKKT
jgi:hypothetical protein